MDISVFINRRKELKLSQVKLSEGICTQATLSKFENSDRVPSLSILSKLCGRLGITVDMLYQGEDDLSKVRKSLDMIEGQLMTEDYRRVLKGLSKINISKVESIPIRMQYYYLRGILNTLINRDPEKALFDFSRILNDLDEKHQTILTQLAFVGSGILYSRRQDYEAAQFYFNKVRRYIQHVYSMDKDVMENNYDLRILTLIYFTSEFFAINENYPLSNQLINTGLALCSEDHVTFYLPRFKFLAAENAIKEHRPHEMIDRLMDEALAFARINNNEVIEVKVAALRKKTANQNG
ncbi:MAG: helix-turn-helix transcriptional regulator [Lentilactobacillus diolivorans]|jgi:transcriptional regulator with XRE-family HTH domain|uniref:helix-turn-helix domain-containing protein n=1 Tax=Lentilactobacillus diolivorans TaxID=179838 RepID=UPI000FF73668|nr:helix-turn-helix transcriptional regulator [Lentilactobacillus diolivorans]MCH4164227.1 helix-turn-helix transcriptional regulator [Lentilactobacillus diolivorans]MDH5104623.1 helix-turn-helix transcriptional regulator [Lentilactobacillus diolivorans]RRG04420.1 MAG: XRE family transcriptional regulator [Lactobacillus sp.]